MPLEGSQELPGRQDCPISQLYRTTVQRLWGVVGGRGLVDSLERNGVVLNIPFDDSRRDRAGEHDA